MLMDDNSHIRHHQSSPPYGLTAFLRILDLKPFFSILHFHSIRQRGNVARFHCQSKRYPGSVSLLWVSFELTRGSQQGNKGTVLSYLMRFYKELHLSLFRRNICWLPSCDERSQWRAISKNLVVCHWITSLLSRQTEASHP